ncbi:MAG: hypothetical protein EXX96DRAFT_555669 [Benjaminiella poitrasii]|nr:MAG: hypothetical protein EXX96DRAFT_555669 [Benjaminiella poitrasii]
MMSNNTTYLMNNRNEFMLIPPPNYNLLSMSYRPSHSDDSPSPPLQFRHNSIGSDSSLPSKQQPQEESMEDDRSNSSSNKASKRDKALERNRQAALRCRQRKKEWLNQLQSSVDMLTKENRALEQQTLTLREEILNLKALLLVHRDCSHAHLTANSINFDNLIFRNSTTSSNTNNTLDHHSSNSHNAGSLPNTTTMTSSV